VDAVTWVAIAGIGGTLFGALGAPIITERLRRQSARDERLTSERIAAYAEYVHEVARFVDDANAQIAGRSPNARDVALVEAGHRAFNRVLVIGSNAVVRLASSFEAAAGALNAALGTVDRAAPDRLDELKTAADALMLTVRQELGTQRR
jgi:hypothetical protein